MMQRLSLIAICASAALVGGCASQNPYDSNHTATYGGIGAVAGAVAGALIDHNDRGKGALIGAALGGVAGAGYGYYADRQEQELRQSMQGTGVEVQRQGDVIQLVMPGNITFATDSAQIATSFYQPLSNLANSFREYNQNTIEVVGYTDSTGSYNYNMELSQRRAQAVADYLKAQGVDPSRISSHGMGPADPIASNATVDGRAQNRRVDITLRPVPGAQ